MKVMGAIPLCILIVTGLFLLGLLKNYVWDLMRVPPRDYSTCTNLNSWKYHELQGEWVLEDKLHPLPEKETKGNIYLGEKRFIPVGMDLCKSKT